MCPGFTLSCVVNMLIVAYFRISQRPALIDGLSLNGTSLHQLRFGRTTSHKVDIVDYMFRL